jgi:hypothetical protein
MQQCNNHRHYFVAHVLRMLHMPVSAAAEKQAPPSPEFRKTAK